MVEYSWSEIRERASATFGDTPHGELEADIIEDFEVRPATVVAVIDRISADIAKGKPIRSGWAVVRASLRQTGRNIVVDDAPQKDRCLRAAHAWLRSAGLYCAKPEDVLEELFDRGVLKPWKQDASLQAEIVEAWKLVRPRGQEAEVRAEAYQRSFRPKRTVGSRAHGRSAPPADQNPAPDAGGDSPRPA